MPEYVVGVDALATAVLVLDDRMLIRQINPAAENLLGLSARQAQRRQPGAWLSDSTSLEHAIRQARERGVSVTEHDLVLNVGLQRVEASAIVSPLETPPGAILIELHTLPGRARIAQEEHVLIQAQAGQMLLRQLAHEMRNPLGGIRGAAQLLEAELGENADLTEYTRVIIGETERLRHLLDRMLTPARRPEIRALNIHTVLERVRSLLLAEYPALSIERDYDISLPEIEGDAEQLIQALLNIARNGAQAMEGKDRLILRTRVARQVTLAMKPRKLAVRIDVIDHGPGIPEALRDTLFFPLVSGRNGGTGLGLSLAQTCIQRHQGAIHVDSLPGQTCFSIYIPIPPHAPNGIPNSEATS